MIIKKISKFLTLTLILIILLGIFIFIMLDSNIINTESINITQISDERDSIVIPVVMYHSVNSNIKKQGKYVILDTAFENDLKYIHENGYTTVFLNDIVNFVKNGSKLPEKPILLTFDDGFYNNYLNVFPLLKKYKDKASISVIGLETERFTKTIDTNENYASLNWKHIKEMQNSGHVEFLNHSYNMHTLNKNRRGSEKNKNESVDEYRKIFIEDATTTQNLFQDNLGFKPIAYTYPFGGISEESYKAIIDMGFVATLDACNGKFTAKKFNDSCLYRIPRYIRTDKITLKNIIEKHFK